MRDTATILIPDISGYTEFVTTTEVEHSAEIITRLLNVIVDSNNCDLVLSEIEGDAVLFYRKGDPIDCQQLLDQCLAMFENFHLLLKTLEKERLCQCEACRGVGNLSLKFIVHFGPISELKIAHISKPAGVDLIIAHRLLKNTIPSSEYLLLTKPFFDKLAGTISEYDIRWVAGSDSYPSIGTIEYQYALLSGLRDVAPETPSVTESDADEDFVDQTAIDMTIQAPLLAIYQKLSNLDLLEKWIGRIELVEKILAPEGGGRAHRELVDGVEIEVIPKGEKVSDDEIRLVDDMYLPQLDLRFRAVWDLKRHSPDHTHMSYKMEPPDNGTLPEGLVHQFMPRMRENLGRLKTICEGEG